MARSTRETNIAGLLLFIGTITILITIYFEYQMGWIGARRPQEEVPAFLFDRWGTLKLIWGWQTVGHALLTVAYLLLLKSSKGIKSLIWAFLTLSGILLVVSLGIALGSYYPALKVYGERPELFSSLRGAISILYQAGQFGSLLLLVIFLLELFGKNGVIARPLGLTVLGIVFSAISIASIASLPIKVWGASWFLLPAVLGYGYWRNSPPSE